ncbi:Uma2 family endonuclease [Streptomyces pathocidini]|uniref:Uma2 family endonuclease n=1 Tax=Streptomyces pathocidini TaxID=1650571 RepID=A0ABW7UVW5_9ACTN|nr:Uma2 family endonuclease [Streptomyces pathocidini]
MDYARMRETAEELAKHAPDPFIGYEIVGDQIVMMMSPGRPHELIAWTVREQLAEQLRGSEPRLVAHTGGEIEDPSIGRLRRPDLIVVPYDIFAEQTMAPFSPHDISLVAEIVSPSNHTNDYLDKMAEYPAMGLPLYLLIDPRKGTIAMLSDPGHGPGGPRYRTRTDYVFGDMVTIGPWTLDTTTFRPYPDGVR